VCGVVAVVGVKGKRDGEIRGRIEAFRHVGVEN